MGGSNVRDVCRMLDQLRWCERKAPEKAEFASAQFFSYPRDY
jgi:hypothetical protein